MDPTQVRLVSDQNSYDTGESEEASNQPSISIAPTIQVNHPSEKVRETPQEPSESPTTEQPAEDEHATEQPLEVESDVQPHEEPIATDSTSVPEIAPTTTLRRSSRTIRPPERYGDWEYIAEHEENHEIGC